MLIYLIVRIQFQKRSNQSEEDGSGKDGGGKGNGEDGGVPAKKLKKTDDMKASNVKKKNQKLQHLPSGGTNSKPRRGRHARIQDLKRKVLSLFFLRPLSFGVSLFKCSCLIPFTDHSFFAAITCSSSVSLPPGEGGGSILCSENANFPLSWSPPRQRIDERNETQTKVIKKHFFFIFFLINHFLFKQNQVNYW